MAKGFRPYSLDQAYLLPVNPREWLSEGHLALFLADVVGQLDLSAIFREYPGGRGPRGYHPQMLLSVLLYGYCVGVYSSRRLAAHCETEVAFRVLSGGAMPDFRLERSSSHVLCPTSASVIFGRCSGSLSRSYGFVARRGWSRLVICRLMARSIKPTLASTRR